MKGAAKPGAGPIIIVKRVKKVSGGHHGGSWKVAYADFVTAMMAFFLLMWLLGAVDKETQEGIANYFKRPLTEVITSGPYPGGGQNADSTGTQNDGMMAPGSDARAFDQVQNEMAQAFQGDTMLQALEGQLSMQITDDGLLIALHDTENRAMFEQGGARVLPHTEHILLVLGRLLDRVPNPIEVIGHTDASPYPGQGSGEYSNWELSCDRANAARRLLLQGGLDRSHIASVQGLADRQLVVPNAPSDPANRRIEVLVKRRVPLNAPEPASLLRR